MSGCDVTGWPSDAPSSLTRSSLDRGFGKAPQSLTADHSGEIVKRIEYLVHWLPKAPDDHSKIIEPEPD